MEKNTASNNSFSDKVKPEDKTEKKLNFNDDTFLRNLMYQNFMLSNTYFQNLINQQQSKSDTSDENDILNNYLSMKKSLTRRIFIFIFVIFGFCLCFFIGYKLGFTNGMTSNMLRL